MAKAFDKIDYGILLKKLNKFPLDKNLIKLLESFLTNRKQIVCVYGAKSFEEITYYHQIYQITSR